VESLGIPVIGVIPLLKSKSRQRRFGFLSREKRLAA
jgi:hypothetical protein